MPLRRELARSRHEVAVDLTAGAPGAGKWANLRAALAARPPDGADWLLVVDDDVVLPRGFLDTFLHVAETAGLRLAQPAHAFASHAAWPVTRRRPGLVARRTRFVEIGPVTALHRDAFAVLLPFPDLAMGWGLDAHWSAVAAARRAAARRGGRDAGPPPAAGRRGVPARGGGRGGRGVPRRPAVRHARGGGSRARRVALMRVAVVAEYYPRAADPVLGVWAHRQALAARDAGAEVHVLVLHRPVPSRAALAARDRVALAAPFRQPLRTERDGLRVDYVPFLAPPRPRTYGAWGAWAAPTLALALRALRRTFPFDLVHAHYAAPAGDAVRRARPGVPIVVSVHGGDLLAVAARSAAGARAVRAGVRSARLVLANSAAMAARARALGAGEARVVHLGTDLPPEPAAPADGPLVTVGHLVARKRHADVLRALWLLRDVRPELRWEVVGDGPERGRWSGWRRSSASPAGSDSTAGCRRRPRSRSPGAAGCSCCRASTRPSASPTWRRWPPASRPSAAGGSRARRTSPRPGAGCCSCRRPIPRRSPPRSARWPRAPSGGRSWARRRGPRSRRPSRGSAAAARP